MFKLYIYHPSHHWHLHGALTPTITTLKLKDRRGESIPLAEIHRINMLSSQTSKALHKNLHGLLLPPLHLRHPQLPHLNNDSQQHLPSRKGLRMLEENTGYCQYGFRWHRHPQNNQKGDGGGKGGGKVIYSWRCFQAGRNQIGHPAFLLL